MGKTTGVILAGGKARRMGRDKALVAFRGQPMVGEVAATIVAAGLDVLVVGRDTPIEGLHAIPDLPHLAGGPALGLLSALLHPDVDDVFLVAVDQPLLRPATIAEIISLPGDCVVPIAEGHPQVTCALYRQSCLRPLEAMLSTGEQKLRRLLDHVDATLVDEPTWRTWGEDGRSWLSLDTPQALREAEALP